MEKMTFTTRAETLSLLRMTFLSKIKTVLMDGFQGMISRLITVNLVFNSLKKLTEEIGDKAKLWDDVFFEQSSMEAKHDKIKGLFTQGVSQFVLLLRIMGVFKVPDKTAAEAMSEINQVTMEDTVKVDFFQHSSEILGLIRDTMFPFLNPEFHSPKDTYTVMGAFHKQFDFFKSFKISMNAMFKLTKMVIGMGMQMFNMIAPQMIIMQPILAFLGGLLEPFSLLGDLLAAFGSALSLVFYPIMIQIVQAIVPFIPILVSIMTVVGEVLLILFNTITPLGIVLGFIKWFDTFLPALHLMWQDFINYFTTVLNPFSERFFIRQFLNDLIEWFKKGVKFDISRNGFISLIHHLLDFVNIVTLRIFSWAIDRLKERIK